MYGAVEALAPHLSGEALIVGKSTVLVDTARDLLARIRAAALAGEAAKLLWSP